MTETQEREGRKASLSADYFRAVTERGIGPRSSVLVTHGGRGSIGETAYYLSQGAVDVEASVAAFEDDGSHLRRGSPDLQELQQAQLLKVCHLGYQPGNGV